MILVDTSVWIDFFNGNASTERDQLRQLVMLQKRIVLTDLIITEILQGIRDDLQYDKVKSTLVQMEVMHAEPVKTYIHAADIYRICRRKGFTIRKTNDCLIAAIAIESDCQLLHKDKDFVAIAECTELRLCQSVE